MQRNNRLSGWFELVWILKWRSIQLLCFIFHYFIIFLLSSFPTPRFLYPFQGPDIAELSLIYLLIYSPTYPPVWGRFVRSTYKQITLLPPCQDEPRYYQALRLCRRLMIGRRNTSCGDLTYPTSPVIFRRKWIRSLITTSGSSTISIFSMVMTQQDA